MSMFTRPAYRFSDNAVGSTSNDFGNYILKRGMGEIRKPSWQRTETVVRFLPQWNFEANEWEPFRRSPAPMDYGDWIRRYDAVKRFGDPGVTMLLYDPISNPAYDVQNNPCILLYKAINQSITNRQCEADWPALLKGAPGQAAPLSRHGPIYVARCAIFRIKSKDMATAERAPLGMATSDSGYFMEIPKTAGEKLISMLEERSETPADDPYDYETAYKYGDIVSLDKGAYVHIFEEGADPKSNTEYAPGGAPRQLAINTGGRGNYGNPTQAGGFKGYDMRIEKTFNGFSPTLNSPEIEQLIKGKQRSWDDCLQFFSNQEQAFLVQDGFPANAILYAWRDHPEWIKDETRSKAVNKVSAMVDARGGYDGRTGQGGYGATPAKVAETQRTQVSATTKTSDPNIKVGGWGDKAAEDAVPKDSVVPGALPETSVAAVDSVLSSSKTVEDRARAALEESKKRMANR